MADPSADPPRPDDASATREREADERGGGSSPGPDDARKTELTDAQAAEALRKISEVQEKLEPLG